MTFRLPGLSSARARLAPPLVTVITDNLLPANYADRWE